MQPDLAPIIRKIRYWHRQRCFAMEQRKRLDLALLSFLRLQLGWSKKLPDAQRAVIAEHAKYLVDVGEKIESAERKAEKKRSKDPAFQRADVVGEFDPVFTEWSRPIRAVLKGRRAFDEVEADAEKQMAALAEQLPVWSDFGEAVRGFGPVSLAVIVGEAGDLSGYATHSKLWKRMGVALVDGVRQGGLAKTAPKADWIKHGYSRMRRSRMWNIGDSLIKAGGEYADIYRARKEIERGKAEAEGLIVAPSAKIPEKRAHEFRSDGHIHRRAQRYMEKSLLRHIWGAWRRARFGVTERSSIGVPAADEHRSSAP